MQTLLLTIRYHGRDFAGWQRQEGFPTVQEHLETALEQIFGEHITVHGAGRTDAGVHALRQTAHIRIPRAFDASRMPAALNGNVPYGIAVTDCRPVPAQFHARFSAIGKRYAYRFNTDPVRPVHGMDLCHWVRSPMSLDAMRAAVQHLVGEHDFASFASNPGYPRTRGTVRRIHHARVVRRRHGMDLMVQGNGFLYNMVRTIAGTLQQIGTGKLAPQRMLEIREARDRREAGMTAPACGLYLVRVLYPDTVWTPSLGGEEPKRTV